MVEQFYKNYKNRISLVKEKLNKPLTLSEKILYSHLSAESELKSYKRQEDYVLFAPDRVAMQDATAQMALLQFMNAGKTKTAIPSSVHCDHLIIAENGLKNDVENANNENKEVYDFLKNVCLKYGIGFWEPGAGIIHQEILEHYAFPGGMILGTDSHTVNGGGLGMISIGVGGADAVDVMVGMPWELKVPKIIGVKLTGKLSDWCSAKDIILKLTGMLTVKGGTGSIVEYFGEGAKSLSATGKATICNMGAEIGATCSIFEYDKNMEAYLIATGRKEVALLANENIDNLQIDKEVLDNPQKYYDQYIELDLNKLEPYINGPFTPDLATPISQFKDFLIKNNYPTKLSVGLIGSCTNSSYQDISRSASLVNQAIENNLEFKSEFIVSLGSKVIQATAERDGMIESFEKVNAKVMANACGPCIGQWNRKNDKPQETNNIITSFNRNFAKRNDGNPNTLSFVASPEIVTAFAIAGDFSFNPLTDKLINKDGKAIKLAPPKGDELPKNGFEMKEIGFQKSDSNNIEIKIDENSKRLQLLNPFEKWYGKDFNDLALLIKVEGKCTTDHISMAGKWLVYRGHLDNISNNLLIGAVNSFNKKTNSVYSAFDKDYIEVPALARKYKANNINSIVIGEENYGEGSSREHAAMEPRHLGVKVILAKSFARIHETNLKKQGMLALTFVNKNDYDLIKEDDKFDLIGLKDFTPNKQLILKIKHQNGNTDEIKVQHTFNDNQIQWFKDGSSLNTMAKR